MKITSSTTGVSPQRKISIAMIAVLLLASSLIIYWMLRERTINELRTIQPSDSAKNNIINSDKNNTPVPTEGLPDDSASTTTSEVVTDANLSVAISSTSNANGLIESTAVTSGSGTCVFLYQPADGGKPVTRQVNATNGSCSVSISQNEFAYLGKWKLTVTYYKDGNKKEVSQSVSIN